MMSKFNLKKLFHNNLPNFNRRFFSSPSKVKEDVGTTSNDNLSARFHQIYLTELEKLEKSSNALVEAKYKVKPNTVPNEAYVHPYHSERFPVFWSSLNFSNSLHEAVGPEPVSPHFESYSMSRRAPIMLFGLVWAFNLVDALNFTTMYGQHATYQIYTLIAFGIGTFEIRYISQRVPAPRITWFYDAYIDHEYAQVVTNWQDKLEESARQFLTISKEQIDFYNIHKEYIFIKKRSLSNYIETEKKNLDKHFYDRSLLMLKNIKRMEDSNINAKIKEITEESLRVVLKKLEDLVSREKIQRESFESALHGLRTGKMTYSNDPILPMILDEIKNRTQDLKKLTPEQENKMFALSNDQKKQVIELDHRAKIDYLSQLPNVASPSVKNSEVYKNIVGRMKRRIEANFSGK